MDYLLFLIDLELLLLKQAGEELDKNLAAFLEELTT